jgi:AraC-like DNA-binding protein
MLRANPCCPLRELSRRLHVSPRNIQNAINAVTGKKFRDLREEVLFVRVKNLLASAPDTPIRKISLEAGYRSPRSFARALRRAHGVSPRQLRTRIARELLASKFTSLT